MNSGKLLGTSFDFGQQKTWEADENKRTYQDDPDYLRVTKKNHAMGTYYIDDERCTNIIKLSLPFREQFGTTHRSHGELRTCIDEGDLGHYQLALTKEV
jgi:hypothetical protein